MSPPARQVSFTNVALIEANARRVPFADCSFDILFNGYMLDLICLADLPVVMSEFYRLLKPGGRLVLVNFSKPEAGRRSYLGALLRAAAGKLGGLSSRRLSAGFS